MHAFVLLDLLDLHLFSLICIFLFCIPFEAYREFLLQKKIVLLKLFFKLIYMSHSNKNSNLTRSRIYSLTQEPLKILALMCCVQTHWTPKILWFDLFEVVHNTKHKSFTYTSRFCGSRGVWRCLSSAFAFSCSEVSAALWFSCCISLKLFQWIMTGVRS